MSGARTRVVDVVEEDAPGPPARPLAHGAARDEEERRGLHRMTDARSGVGRLEWGRGVKWMRVPCACPAHRSIINQSRTHHPTNPPSFNHLLALPQPLEHAPLVDPFVDDRDEVPLLGRPLRLRRGVRRVDAHGLGTFAPAPRVVACMYVYRPCMRVMRRTQNNLA